MGGLERESVKKGLGVNLVWVFLFKVQVSGVETILVWLSSKYLIENCI